MIERLKKINRVDILVMIILALFLIYGLVAFNDYNLSLDEEVERYTGLINYKELLQIGDEQIGSVDFGALPELTEWRDRYYGAAAQYIPLLVEHLFGFTMETHRIYQIRHLFTFLVFWLACAFFYRLCTFLGAKKDEALLGMLMLMLSPRILGDSFYNIKDSFFLSVVILNLYAGVRYIDKTCMGRGIVLAMISAICINVRVLGAEILVFCLLIIGIQALREKKIVFCVKYVLGIAILSLLFYIFITPITWSGVIEAIVGILSTFSNYSPWTGINYFAGDALYAWELPWYYIPLWILVTTPVLYVFLMGCGAVFYGKRLIKGQYKVDYAKLVVILYVLVPLVYAMVRTPALYNGWRHFYFIYPGLILAAVYGWHQLKKKLCNRRYVLGIAYVGGAAYLALTGIWILKNHPLECVYFNEISREYARDYMEKDYWYMAQQEAILWIAENDNRDQITVYGGYINYLPEGETKNRLKSTSRENAEYIVYSNITNEETERFDGLHLIEKKGEASYVFDGFDLYDEVYRIEVDGMTICSVYRRNYNKNEGANLKYTEGILRYDLNGMSWSTYEEEGLLWFEGKTAELLAPDRIGLQCNMACLPCMVALSEDGTVWTYYDADAWTERGESRIQIDLDSVKTQYIRLGFEQDMLCGDEGQETWELRVGFYYRTDTPIQWRDSLTGIAQVDASENQWAQGFAVDGDVATRWDSGISQRLGIAYTIEWEEKVLLGGFTLDHGEYVDDYPRELIAYGSLDGETWTEIPLEEGAFGYYECEKTEVRYLRMELESESTWNWSICEIKFWIVP